MKKMFVFLSAFLICKAALHADFVIECLDAHIAAYEKIMQSYEEKKEVYDQEYFYYKGKLDGHLESKQIYVRSLEPDSD